MNTDRDFITLLTRLSDTYGDRTALRYGTAPGDVLSYRGLLERVKCRMDELKDIQTIEVREDTRLDWIITCLASICGGHMTVLPDPSLPSVYSEETYVADYLPGKILFFTSGTTSRNKAVILSQQALLQSAANGQAMLPCSFSDRLLSMLPLFHVFGFVCSFLWPLTQGAEIDLGSGYHGFLTDAKVYEPTIISIVPTLLDLMLRADALNSRLRMILVGAGPCRRELIEQVLARGIHLRFGYGLTETASGVAISVSDDDPYSLAPCPDTRFSVSSDGELLLGTTCMMDGYYLNPAVTALKLSGGVLHTGDLAETDSRGYIHIIGRTDEVLVMPNGEKIFCPEIENDLSLRLNRECVLVFRGGTLTLVVHASPEDGTMIRRTIDEYNLSRPIGRKVGGVEIRTEDFPRTLTGKIQRYRI